jgi:hypothetical protein
MSCDHPTVAQHIADTDLIFFGKVLTVKALERSMSDGLLEWRNTDGNRADSLATIKVERAYKGVETDTVDIAFLRDGGAIAGWGFSRSRHVLVFAKKFPAADKQSTIGYLNYCNMIPYYARDELRAEYWETLVQMQQNAKNAK